MTTHTVDLCGLLLKETTRKRLRLLAVSLATASLLGFTTPLVRGAGYNVTGLGEIGGEFDSSIATSINNAGQVVGIAESTISSDTHGFIYQGGTLTDLNPTFGGTNSNAQAINASGQIVGFSDNSGVIDTGGTITTIPTLAGGYNGNSALAISNNGLVAGEAFTYSAGNYRPYEAYVYDPSHGLSDIGNLGGNSQAVGINNSGQVVGESDVTGGGQHAFLYQYTFGSSSTMQDLGTLPGGSNSVANAINNAGEIVGASDETGNAYQAAIFHPGGAPTPLPDLGGGDSEALGINDLGEIVGDSYDALGNDDAILDVGGVMLNLNALIDPSSGWDLLAAYSINDSGDIVGVGYDPSGHVEAFELSPVPEPVSLGMLGAGMLGLVRRRRVSAK